MSILPVNYRLLPFMYKMFPYTDSFEFWAPLFVIHNEEEGIPAPFVVVYIIETISIIFAVVCMILYAITLSKTALFHKNLTAVLVLLAFMCSTAFTSRIVMLLYQTNLVTYTGFTLQDFPLVFCCYFRLFFLAYVSALVPSILMERVFASYFIYDYEKVQRRWIAVVVTIPTILFSFYLTKEVSSRKLSVPFTLFLTSGLVSASIVTYIIIYRFNSKKLNLLNKWSQHSDHRYTLSVKFQLAENVRVMKVLLCCTLMVFAFFTVAISFLAYGLVIGESRPEARLYLAAFDFVIAICPVVLIVSSLTIKQWRNALIRSCFSACCVRFQTAPQHFEAASNSRIADTHFGMINQAWRN